MSEFRVFETTEFARSLKRLDTQSIDRLCAVLKKRVYPQLRKQPFFGANIKKLRDYVPDTWRYRIGDFRLFYTINVGEQIVSVLAIENRRDAYR